jgi:hypothetical protein
LIVGVGLVSLQHLSAHNQTQAHRTSISAITRYYKLAPAQRPLALAQASPLTPHQAASPQTGDLAVDLDLSEASTTATLHPSLLHLHQHWKFFHCALEAQRRSLLLSLHRSRLDSHPTIVDIQLSVGWRRDSPLGEYGNIHPHAT